jgi:cystathionine gamma-synthase
LDAQSVSAAILATGDGPQAPLASQRLSPLGLPLVPSLQLSAAYQFTNSEALASHHSDKHESVRYARDAGENASQLDAVMEVLHPGFRALSFSSGMSAVAALLTTFWPSMNRLFLQDEVYRKTSALVEEMAAVSALRVERYGVFPDSSAEPADPEPGDVYFLELPSNPHLRLPDPAALRAAVGPEPTIILDATISGLGTLAPEVLGAVDAVVYSCTKYAGGHNDIIGGSALVRPADFPRLWEVRSKSGSIIAPMDAYLLTRSLRTFDVRFAQQLDNTRLVLERLTRGIADGAIERVFYPGSFANTDQAEVFDRTLTSGGALLSFVASRPREELAARMSTLEVMKMAPSFGSVDSLLEITSLMSQAGVDDAGLRKIRLEPNLIRLSIGIEPIDRILGDLELLLD